MPDILKLFEALRDLTGLDRAFQKLKLIEYSVSAKFIADLPGVIGSDTEPLAKEIVE